MAVLNVNGKTVQANADPRTPLLWCCATRSA